MELPSPSASSATSPIVQNTIRSRSGCRICREKKVKCDEGRPQCLRCLRLNRECDYKARPRKKYTWRVPVPPSHPPASPDDTHLEATEVSSPPLAASDTATPGPHTNLQRLQHLVTNSEEARSPSQTHGPIGDSLSHDCLRILSPLDHAAIHYFRFVLPTAVDSKLPEHSGPAIVWTLAERDPMVLHSVCALAGGKVCEQNVMSAEETKERKSLAVEHYTAGLRLLHCAIQDDTQSPDFDCVLATLWLMIAYEQKFGDGCGVGLDAHLQGAASLFRGRLRALASTLNRSTFYLDTQQEREDRMHPSQDSVDYISPLACRLIIWIALIDGGAAVNGFGGAFNILLGEGWSDLDNDAALSRTKCFGALQRHSDLMNLEVWGKSYPQSQLVEDLQSGQLFGLYAESGQLRFLLGELSVYSLQNDSRYETRMKAVSSSILDVETRYRELLRTASLLELGELESQRRFVANARFIAAFYHSVVLCFLRIANGNKPLVNKQRVALREIMTLAFNAHRDQGEQAMIRFAWPLFVAALETDDVLHRTWDLQRYDALAVQGENFRRAREALGIAFSEQDLHERRVDYAELVRRDNIDRFVI
ncbi:hypothetical protein G7Z17_g8231 [Cylindrodendrum hubeiense]|uniref:Zn(2)-C6 fungal-type domain-containing protein n=1 Tax=Cylindrodendrum hubeiense TaxID=595255 RepID=A0A9P5LEI6_9HYPO|nr:hypothetical protein G7Z17_g8231 [Cylindrodendrum hubeiense]